MSERLCLFCGEAIPSWENGNRKYCSSDHYYLAKLDRQGQRYANDKSRWRYHRSMESKLAHLARKWGLNANIPMEELEALEFDTYVCDSKIRLNEHAGLLATVIGSYCYAIINNQYVKIWRTP